MITPKASGLLSMGQRSLLLWESNTGHPRERNQPSQTSYGACHVPSLPFASFRAAINEAGHPAPSLRTPGVRAPTSFQRGSRVTFPNLLSASVNITGTLNYSFQWGYYPCQEKTHINPVSSIVYFLSKAYSHTSDYKGVRCCDTLKQSLSIHIFLTWFPF